MRKHSFRNRLLKTPPPLRLILREAIIRSDKRSFYKRGFQQVIDACFHPVELFAAMRIFYFDPEVLHSVRIELVEDIFEVHHPRLAQYHAVFDVQHMDPISSFLQVFHRIVLPHDRLIDIHLE